MIQFLISHSISLYCQTQREENRRTDRDMRERGTDEDGGMQRERERKMDGRVEDKK